ncbi:Gfo/Idh/MocA family protein [Desulfosporosinus nitroreducens]|uniref:Gfo/Idh/MocA family oxidoreductase n=1 Tax=Desulfosporosinus nitroreducens TaxID=2018668 RepID=A0ABT8QXS4_9FIRM|nr:Gfo/Idh/MocA family oxidoreductase [Desulfosporosinus nitroreducens]MDO0825374.1 Gfo/Idh/MocA family oxidoreductase [Desulfosporosinus nitroreducens]
MAQYKAAVIGLGQIGLTYDFDPKREKPSSHVFAYHLNPRIELVAAVDVRADQYQALHKIAPSVNFYQSMVELLKNHSVDIISVCTPPVHHLSAIQYILQNTDTKIIFCEKPLVSCVDEANLLTQILQKGNRLLIPNLSRRWNSGIQRVKAHIANGQYGELQKIHVKYTRGIHNTGSHIFDLLHWWGGQISEVQAIKKIKTSADYDSDPSYTFAFLIDKNILGFAEAFDDEQYYLFEIDLYFSKGKIEIRNSGDDVFYYQVGEHHLYTGFKSLYLERYENQLLSESNLGNAINHLVNILDGLEHPICTVEHGVYPLYVAETIIRSFNNHCSKERVRL